jgi:NhaP-type Na+/H+ or K+/H+ antiporter
MIAESTITGWDWIKMLAFWVLMIIIRAIMVLTFVPILKATGYGITKKEIVVLIYGGLRGALGLCLSLMVGVDEELPVRFRELTVFYMCGMAVLTIVANGLTCGKLVDYVEMIHYPEIKRKLFRRCVKDVL